MDMIIADPKEISISATKVWSGIGSPSTVTIIPAINLDLPQEMHLYWRVAGDSPPYMHNYCRSLADALDNFSYHAISGASESAEAVAKRVIADHPPSEGFRCLSGSA